MDALELRRLSLPDSDVGFECLDVLSSDSEFDGEGDFGSVCLEPCLDVRRDWAENVFFFFFFLFLHFREHRGRFD